MKKIAILTIVVFTIMSGLMNVSAQSEPNQCEIIFLEIPSSVQAGEEIILMAKVLKQGSSYHVAWDGADHIETVKKEDFYLSSASFTADKPGSYNVTFSIAMHAGKSHITFANQHTVQIEVVGNEPQPVTVVGADIKNITYTTLYRTDGSILGYRAIGTSYALFSDGTSKPHSTLSFTFGATETQRTVMVTLHISGKAYTFPVVVERPE